MMMDYIKVSPIKRRTTRHIEVRWYHYFRIYNHSSYRHRFTERTTNEFSRLHHFHWLSIDQNSMWVMHILSMNFLLYNSFRFDDDDDDKYDQKSIDERTIYFNAHLSFVSICSSMNANLHNAFSSFLSYSNERERKSDIQTKKVPSNELFIISFLFILVSCRRSLPIVSHVRNSIPYRISPPINWSIQHFPMIMKHLPSPSSHHHQHIPLFIFVELLCIQPSLHLHHQQASSFVIQSPTISGVFSLDFSLFSSQHFAVIQSINWKLNIYMPIKNYIISLEKKQRLSVDYFNRI